ncbi:hypothetical protein D3C81_1969220 [compost metagenome]
MFAHQAGIGRLDEDFDLDRALVLGKAIALYPANLDLLVEHRAIAVERAQAIGFERKVQARFAVRKRWRHLQCLEALGSLTFARADGNVIT